MATLGANLAMGVELCLLYVRVAVCDLDLAAMGDLACDCITTCGFSKKHENFVRGGYCGCPVRVPLRTGHTGHPQ